MSTLSIDHTSTDPNNYLEHRLQGRDLIIELLDYSIIIRTVQLLNNAVIVVIIDQDLDLSQPCFWNCSRNRFRNEKHQDFYTKLFPERSRFRSGTRNMERGTWPRSTCRASMSQTCMIDPPDDEISWCCARSG